MTLSRAAVLAIVLSSVLPAGSALADSTVPPPSLTGETLFQFFPACSKNGPGTDPADCTAAIASPPPRVVQRACNREGTTSLSFDVAGVASGPYNGTFTEHVDAQIGPQATVAPFGGSGGPFQSSTFGFSAGVVQSWDASFTIYSGDYTVTGTKHLDTVSAGNVGFCADLQNEPGGIFPIPVTGSLDVANAANLSYDATVHGAGGAYAVTGTSRSIVREGFVYSDPNPLNDRVRSVFGEFGQVFDSGVVGKPGLGCGDKNHIHVREDECQTLSEPETGVTDTTAG